MNRQIHEIQNEADLSQRNQTLICSMMNQQQTIEKRQPDLRRLKSLHQGNVRPVVFSMTTIRPEEADTAHRRNSIQRDPIRDTQPAAILRLERAAHLDQVEQLRVHQTAVRDVDKSNLATFE